MQDGDGGGMRDDIISGALDLLYHALFFFL